MKRLVDKTELKNQSDIYIIKIKKFGHNFCGNCPVMVDKHIEGIQRIE